MKFENYVTFNFPKKLYWNTGMPIHLHMVYGLFLSYNGDRDFVMRKD